jgi:selenocysteine lyase/cysteine desulfurase
VWDGHFYAVRPIEVLGLADRGGVIRVGMSMYNTHQEVERLLDALARLAA